MCGCVDVYRVLCDQTVTNERTIECVDVYRVLCDQTVTNERASVVLRALDGRPQDSTHRRRV